MGFTTPQTGASLMLSFRLEQKTTVLLGSGSLAASRAFSALEAGSSVVVLSRGGRSTACEEIQWRADQGQLIIIDLSTLPSTSDSSSEEKDAEAIDHFLSTTNYDISFVCITDTVSGVQNRRSNESAERIYRLCKAKNIFVNTTDIPSLCDFSFTSTHRFESPSGSKSSLQIGITTNGQGCRLAGRIRRDIVSKLPKDVGGAVEKVGRMRRLSKEEDGSYGIDGDDCYEDSGITTPNRPVPQRTISEIESIAENGKRRMRWVAQISEYWSIQRLANLTDDDIREILSGDYMKENADAIKDPQSIHSLSVRSPGRILLVGSGPGHPSLLTLATHTALTKLANLVLSDKLVPDAVLAIIPPTVEVRIAKKFPGNAEGAQNEMMEAAVEAANRGLTVVRVRIAPFHAKKSSDNISS